MTGDETTADTEEQQQTAADPDEEQPEISEDDMADFSAVAEDVASDTTDTDSEEPTEPTDDTGESEQGSGEQSASQDPTESAPELGGEISIGEVYCNGLGMAAAISRTKYGSANSDDRDRLADEYADLARQIELDRWVDQYQEQSAHLDALTPGQAVLLGSMMFAGAVVMDDPEMLDAIAGKEENHAE